MPPLVGGAGCAGDSVPHQPWPCLLCSPEHRADTTSLQATLGEHGDSSQQGHLTHLVSVVAAAAGIVTATILTW